MEQNKTISIINNIKKSRIRFELIRSDSGSSLPIPLRIGEKICLAFLFYTSDQHGGLGNHEKVSIFRPNSKIIVDYIDGRIVHYQDYFGIDEFAGVGMEELIGEVKPISREAYMERRAKRNALMGQYDKIIKLFRDNTNEDGIKKDFRILFYELCLPCLLPFMKKVGQDFFVWLNE